jgi:hypothetical protein
VHAECSTAEAARAALVVRPLCLACGQDLVIVEVAS